MDLEEYDLWSSEYIKELKEKSWVEILSITAPSKWLTKTRIEKIFEIADILKVQLVTFSPPHISDRSKTWFTKFIQEEKNNFNFSIAIQNVENKYIFFLIPEYRNMPLADLKNITWFTSLDIWNINNSSSIDIIKANEIFWNSMKNVYFSDKKWDRSGLIPWKESSWISNLPLESFLMHLKANVYNWFITLKVNPQELWVWDEITLLKNLEKIKKYYTKYYIDFV